MILSAFAAAAVAPLLFRALRSWAAPVLALVPAGLVGALVSRLPLDPANPWQQALAWAPEFGVSLAFRLDGLATVFALLINGIGVLILLYAGAYMRDDPKLGRLLSYLLLFLGAMFGIVLSDDLISLFIFWELTSVASFLLIGFKHDKTAARDAARQALLITGGGGLALLAGLILLGIIGGASGLPAGDALRISTLATVDTATLMAHPLFPAALVLIALGAFSKSAQMPLHFWLPNAMAAPTPVSAYLHSATMVKAGVFLLARLNPIFTDSVLWQTLLTTTGAVTMLGAAALAVGQTDLKRILAYTTVSVLGTLTMLIGIGTDLAIKAMVVYLVAHACYKAALFLMAGTLEHSTGTRDVEHLSGLFGKMPVTALTGLIAALSMAGAPPLFGFIGKELLLKAKLDLEWIGVILILVATAANIFMIAMAFVVSLWPFYGKRVATPQTPHEPPLTMLLGPGVLAITGVFIGVAPDFFDQTLGTPMATAVAGAPLEMKLKLWHGLSPVALTALAISVVTLILGLILFIRLRTWLVHTGAWVARVGRVGPARGYDIALAGLFDFAAWLTARTQPEHLRSQVLFVLCALIAVAVYPLAQVFALDRLPALELHWYDLLLVGLVLAGAIGSITTNSRLSAIAMLGVTGLLIAVLFAVFSAPDLAMTQIMVEALTVILLVLVFHILPRFQKLRSRACRLRDLAIALAAGSVMTGLILASSLYASPTTVSDTMANAAKPEAFGRNVVNVILVDFRALDTFGEVIVVAVAGLGVLALLRLYRGREPAAPPPQGPPT